MEFPWDFRIEEASLNLINTKYSVLLLLVIFLTSSISARCMPEEKSYKHYVEKSTFSSTKKENLKTIAKLKKHLKCYPDKKVFFKLAVIYEFQKKYYLAGLAYKKAGKNDEYNRIQQIIIQKKNTGGEFFLKLAKDKSEKLYKQYKTKKAFSTAFLIIGPIAFATGLSLFIHDEAGGTNSITAQYVLMLGGLTMISGGAMLNAHAEKDRLFSNAYRSLHENNFSEPGLTPTEFLASSGNKNLILKHISSKHFACGLAMAAIAWPIIGFGIYSYFDTANYRIEKDDGEDPSSSLMNIEPIINFLLYFFVQSAVFVPAISSLIIGARMMARSSKWENFTNEPTLLTLKSISPMINPITKTYGISMGFSF